MTPNSQIGPYSIVSKLGEGGMGEVYRAVDNRLKRQVAIKMLPSALAVDPERLARFQREAEVLASLNHSHIATIYGFEDTVEGKALVMELVEGPTLADRITEGPIPLDEALPIAKQIAEALATAHEQGIIHRDLKPANIKVRDDGAVKVLDFGLAKLAEMGRGNAEDPALSPTTMNLTAMGGPGVILGTAAYMSPEQARGRTVDKRTDVWAFGAVLYEMLTGTRAFGGEDVTEMIAAVMKSAPDWTRLASDVPPQVVTLIQRCLEKDRGARISDLAVARYLLSEPALAGTPVAPVTPATPMASAATATPPSASPRLAWMTAAVCAAAALVAGIAWLRGPSGSIAPEPTHLQMPVLPAGELMGSNSSIYRPARTGIAISPDGRSVAFAGRQNGVLQLYLRAFDRDAATPLAGTEAPINPIFSPDGAWIAFASGDKIKKVPIAGGPAATICDVPGGRVNGIDWADEGTIFFAGATDLFKVPSSGGTPVSIAKPDASSGERLLSPHALPGGKGLLYTSINGYIDWTKAKVVLLSTESGEKRVLIEGAADGRYVNSGHLAFMKSGTLMAVLFDLQSRQVHGGSATLVDGVLQATNAGNAFDETGAGQFAVSESGTLIYALGGIGPVNQNVLQWLDRSGNAETLPATPGPYFSPRLSPDGTKVAVSARRGATRATDIWVYDVARGLPTRLTFDDENGSPLWLPDGKRVVFAKGGLYAVDADGSGKAEQLVAGSANQTSSSYGPNGLVFMQRPNADEFGFWLLPSNSSTGSSGITPRLFLQSRFALTHPEVSHDGHWIAYVSPESGTREIYVQRFPEGGEKTRISTTGGSEPVWNASGRELLYRSGNPATGRLQFLSVAIRSLAPFQADAPRVLFEAKEDYSSTTPVRSWDVSADGRRFLVVKVDPAAGKPVTAIEVVLNWTEHVKQLAK